MVEYNLLFIKVYSDVSKVFPDFHYLEGDLYKKISFWETKNLNFTNRRIDCTTSKYSRILNKRGLHNELALG